MKRDRARCPWCDRDISVSDVRKPSGRFTRHHGMLKDHSAGTKQWCDGCGRRAEIYTDPTAPDAAVTAPGA